MTTTIKPVRWFTPPQIARLLGVAGDRVRRWIDAGELDGVNLSSPGIRPRYRISSTALDEFLARRRVCPHLQVAHQGRRRPQLGQVQEFV